MRLPFFTELDDAETILIAGAGGGFDELFINPLMAQYWAFHLKHVARRNLYLERIANTTSYGELSLAIEAFHATLPKTRVWRDIPC